MFELLCFLRTLESHYSLSSTLNYASTANIREVMKVYNLGNKTFETDSLWGFAVIVLKMPEI